MAELRTPKTSTVRAGWLRGHPFPQTTDVEEREAEFDRWLAAHDAELKAATLAEIESLVTRTVDPSPALPTEYRRAWGDAVHNVLRVIRARPGYASEGTRNEPGREPS